MKKLIYITGAALVMLASASCEKKETVKEAQPSVEKTEMVFTATSGNGELKTTIQSDGVTAVWSATDNLKVFTETDQTGSVCDYKSGAGTATAEFEGQCAKKGPWTAICPAIDGATYSAGTITFTMPETQTYAENTFADGAMPCVAYSETNTFNFSHSFGVLKLSLKLKSGTSGSVKSITVTTKGSEKLNGTFTVNPQNGAAATYSTGGTSSITLNCTNVALSTSTATDFWIVVPQGAFANGFDVTVTSTNDWAAKMSTTKANTITAGKVKEMPVQIIEFKEPTTGEASVEGQVYSSVRWIQLWENGPKWAEYGVNFLLEYEYETSDRWYFSWGDGHETMLEDWSYSEELTGIWDPCEEKKDIQSGDYDTAKLHWGDNWKMPKKDDFDGLLKNCDVTTYWGDSRYEDCHGVLFRGRGDYADNSVFFAAAGWGQVYYDSDDNEHASRHDADVMGCYWSSTPFPAVNSVYFLEISATGQNIKYKNPGNPKSALCVRAILAE